MRAATATVLIGVGGTTATSAHAATTCPTVNGVTPGTCVTSVTLSRSTAAVSGAASVPLIVRIGFHSDLGVPSGGMNPSLGGEAPDVAPELRFNVRRHQQSYRDDRVGLALATGDAHDGVWKGTLHITALDLGTITTSFVNVGAVGSTHLVRVPIPVALRRSVTVLATHIPRFESDMIPPGVVKAGASFTVSGRVIDTGTRAGMPRITVWVQELDSSCGCFVGRYATTTDAAGDWHVLVPHLTQFEYVASVEGPINSDGRRANIATAYARPYVLGSVTATLAAATARVGDTVLVTGSANPAFGRVVLEKWVSHSWRTVASTPVRASGRFTLPATPSAAGHWEYRVTDSDAHSVSAPKFLDAR